MHPCIRIQHFIVDLTDWVFSSQLKLRENIFSSSVSEEEEIDEDKNLKVGELSHVPGVFSALLAVTNTLSRDKMPL